MKDPSLNPDAEPIDYRVFDVSHGASESPPKDPNWSQSWFAPTANPGEITPKSSIAVAPTGDADDPVHEFNRRLNASEVHRSFILYRARAGKYYCPPGVICLWAYFRVTPFEVISDLRESLRNMSILTDFDPGSAIQERAKAGNSRII